MLNLVILLKTAVFISIFATYELCPQWTTISKLKFYPYFANCRVFSKDNVSEKIGFSLKRQLLQEG
jgi:hypothetical protein